MKYSLEDLRKINESKIEDLQNEAGKELEIQSAIKEILKRDDCFFKMEITTAMDLLTKLIKKDDIKETYMDLISAQNFKKIIL